MRGLLAIGASLGGIQAIVRLFSHMRQPLGVPIVLVQHRPAEGPGGLSQLLSHRTGWRACEPDHGASLHPDIIYVAPAAYHMMVEGGQIALDAEERVNFARPSIDVLFRTAADAQGERLCTVLLTCSSRDGAEGLCYAAERGATVMVQDPATAESDVAISAALQACEVTFTGDIPKLAEQIAVWSSQLG